MKHLYRNGDGETVAADTLEQASRYYDCELGGADTPGGGWYEVPDNATVCVETERKVDKAASDWAAEYDRVTLVSTTTFA